MALTYDWKLKSLKKTSTGDYQDLVVGTHWECTGTDEDGNVGTFHGATPFKAEEVESDNFVAYKDLTEEVVLSWVKAVVDSMPNYKQHIDEQIIKQIEGKKSPIEDIGADALPWSAK